MIRIVKGAEVDGPRGEAGRHGVWAYRADRYPLVCGFSRQPLLDACRQLKSLYGLNGERVGLFREGKDDPDISCFVEVGAAITVKEPSNGAIRFGKYVDLSKVFLRPAKCQKKLRMWREKLLDKKRPHRIAAHSQAL
jgi:hypothetical protein